MLEHDLDESVGFWITVANQAYMRALTDELAPHGITFRQAQVLGWLAVEGPLPQSQLASRMLIEPPSLVGVLDRMEEANLIERRPCTEDRRRKLVHIRPSAKCIWKRITECGLRVRRQAMQGLTKSEIALLKKLLQKVQTNVSP